MHVTQSSDVMEVLVKKVGQKHNHMDFWKFLFVIQFSVLKIETRPRDHCVILLMKYI